MIVPPDLHDWLQPLFDDNGWITRDSLPGEKTWAPGYASSNPFTLMQALGVIANLSPYEHFVCFDDWGSTEGCPPDTVRFTLISNHLIGALQIELLVELPGTVVEIKTTFEPHVYVFSGETLSLKQMLANNETEQILS